MSVYLEFKKKTNYFCPIKCCELRYNFMIAVLQTYLINTVMVPEQICTLMLRNIYKS